MKQRSNEANSDEWEVRSTAMETVVAALTSPADRYAQDEHVYRRHDPCKHYVSLIASCHTPNFSAFQKSKRGHQEAGTEQHFVLV